MFYPRNFPNLNELVMCTISDTSEIGIIVNLLEYDNLSGFLPYNQIPHKLILKVNNKIILNVIDVCKNNNITLSRKFITADDNLKAHEKYNILF